MKIEYQMFFRNQQNTERPQNSEFITMSICSMQMHSDKQAPES
jgi:hypothetical protein